MQPSPSSSSAPRSSRGALAAWGTAIVVASTVLLGALLPARPGHPMKRVAEDAACLEWTDGCRVCQRLAQGPACSLPGIACTPVPERCLRRAGG